MPTNRNIRATLQPAIAHVNAAIDGLLEPFRGADGNCPPFTAFGATSAEIAARNAVMALEAARAQLDAAGRATRVK